MTDALYLTEARIAEKVLGKGRLDEWRALAVILERRGFPKIDPEFGARYWPKCELWFQVENGLVSIAPGRLGKQDGGETCPEPKKRQASSGAPGAAPENVYRIGSREPAS